jgi:hypothetical protein
MTARVPFEGHPKAYACELYRTYMERKGHNESAAVAGLR